MLSLANIALLVATLHLRLCCDCQCSTRTQSCGKPLFKTGLFPLHWSPFYISGSPLQPFYVLLNHNLSMPTPGSWSVEIPTARCQLPFLFELIAPGVLTSQSFTFCQGTMIPAILGIKVFVLNYKAGTALKRKEYQITKFNLSFTIYLCLEFSPSRTASYFSVTGHWPR